MSVTALVVFSWGDCGVVFHFGDVQRLSAMVQDMVVGGLARALTALGARRPLPASAILQFCAIVCVSSQIHLTQTGERKKKKKS